MDQNMDNPMPTPEENPQDNQSTYDSSPPAESGALLSKEAKQWAMFCHLAGLAMFLPIAPIPIGNVLGPLIIWLIKKDDFPFVREQGKEALNFQISMSIYFVACFPLLCLFMIGAFIMPIVGIVDLIFLIIASIHVSDGKDYRYPLTLRLIK